MNNTFSIRNFKIFNSEGVSFDLKPISLVTGQNSSGKSTLTKSLVLLYDYFQQAHRQIKADGRFEPASYKLNFAIPELKLGGFNIEKNRNSSDEEICFSYSFRPHAAARFLFTIEYGFKAIEEDILNNGWLSHIEVKAKYEDTENKLLRIDVTDGKAEVTTLSLDNVVFYHSFDVAFLLINFLRINDLKAYCYDEFGEIVDEERYNHLNNDSKKLETLDTHFFEEELEGIKQIYNKIYDENKFDAFSAIFNPDLVEAINRINEDSLIFYFPILERLRDVTKEEAIEIIRNAELGLQYHVYGMYNASDAVEAIVTDFKESSHDSFFDYYRELENDKLADLTPKLEMYIAGYDEDIFERIKMRADVSYSSHMDLDSSKFMKVYKFLCNWQITDSSEVYEKYINVNITGDSFHISHKLYSAYHKFLQILLQEILLPESFNDVRYIGSTINEVKRQYPLYDNKDSFIKTIERYLNNKREYLQAIKENQFFLSRDRNLFQPGDFINKWLKELNVGQKLNIIINQDAQCIHINISKDEENKHIVSLADEGYGVNHLVTLLVSIESEILNLKRLSIVNKRIPTIGEIPPKPYVLPTCTLLIEEPEVGLHPAFQSKLAAMFLEATKMFEANNLQFVIETHSEYLIRSTQVYVAHQNYDEVTLKKNCPFLVNYVPLNGLPYDLEYTPSGRFVKKFGEGFFDMTSSLNYELYRLEHNKQ